MKTFDSQKEKYLEALYKPDKSKKGNVDEKVSPIIDCLNEKENYVSTSSCSGRIDLLLKSESGKKHEAEWPYVTHGLADENKIWNTMEEVTKRSTSKLWLKMEAPILHIMCRDLESAQNLVDAAKKVGFKYSGTFVSKPERFMVEIMACEKIETLVATKGNILVSKDYIDVATKECNLKLSKAHERLNKLFEEVKKL